MSDPENFDGTSDLSEILQDGNTLQTVMQEAKNFLLAPSNEPFKITNANIIDMQTRREQAAKITQEIVEQLKRPEITTEEQVNLETIKARLEQVSIDLAKQISELEARVNDLAQNHTETRREVAALAQGGADAQDRMKQLENQVQQLNLSEFKRTHENLLSRLNKISAELENDFLAWIKNGNHFEVEIDTNFVIKISKQHAWLTQQSDAFPANFLPQLFPLCLTGLLQKEKRERAHAALQFLTQATDISRRFTLEITTENQPEDLLEKEWSWWTQQLSALKLASRQPAEWQTFFWERREQNADALASCAALRLRCYRIWTQAELQDTLMWLLENTNKTKDWAENLAVLNDEQLQALQQIAAAEQPWLDARRLRQCAAEQTLGEDTWKDLLQIERLGTDAMLSGYKFAIALAAYPQLATLMNAEEPQSYAKTVAELAWEIFPSIVKEIAKPGSEWTPAQLAESLKTVYKLPGWDSEKFEAEVAQAVAADRLLPALMAEQSLTICNVATAPAVCKNEQLQYLLEQPAPDTTQLAYKQAFLQQMLLEKTITAKDIRKHFAAVEAALLTQIDPPQIELTLAEVIWRDLKQDQQKTLIYKIAATWAAIYDLSPADERLVLQNIMDCVKETRIPIGMWQAGADEPVLRICEGDKNAPQIRVVYGPDKMQLGSEQLPAALCRINPVQATLDVNLLRQVPTQVVKRSGIPNQAQQSQAQYKKIGKDLQTVLGILDRASGRTEGWAQMLRALLKLPQLKNCRYLQVANDFSFVFCATDADGKEPLIAEIFSRLHGAPAERCLQLLGFPPQTPGMAELFASPEIQALVMKAQLDGLEQFAQHFPTALFHSAAGAEGHAADIAPRATFRNLHKNLQRFLNQKTQLNVELVHSLNRRFHPKSPHKGERPNVQLADLFEQRPTLRPLMEGAAAALLAAVLAVPIADHLGQKTAPTAEQPAWTAKQAAPPQAQNPTENPIKTNHKHRGNTLSRQKQRKIATGDRKKK